MTCRNRSLRWQLFFCFAVTLTLGDSVARGDAVVEVKVGGDSIALPRKVTSQDGCQPCVPPPQPGDSITYYADGDRARRDRGPLSVVLNKEKKKVYFLCTATRQYSQLAYPVSYQKALRDDYRKGLGDVITFQLAAPAKQHPGQVNQWKVDIFEATVMNGLRDQYRIHVGVAGALTGIDGLLLELRKLLHELEHFGHGWSSLLPFTTGVPIVWEERQRQPETEFVYREEVSKIDLGDVSPEKFIVPSGYAEIPYDRGCFPAR